LYQFIHFLQRKKVHVFQFRQPLYAMHSSLRKSGGFGGSSSDSSGHSVSGERVSIVTSPGVLEKEWQ
jgi:hypothetical protein